MLIKDLKLRKCVMPQKPLSVKDFHQKRNKILILRSARGMGDILMSHMLFQGIKEEIPDSHLTFACKPEYHVLLKNHPFLDALADSDKVNIQNYMISYNISNCCIVYEAMHPIADKHRADIWAQYCGIKLKSHNMFLPFISPEEINAGIEKVKLFNTTNKPAVLFSPFAYDRLRTLLPHQIRDTVDFLKRDHFVYYTHKEEHPLMTELKIPLFTGNVSEWLSYIHAADYVVTADTCVFHYAGGIGKPMTGIFTHVDGKFRGQYFDFELVQKHRDNGDWMCGPCYNYAACSHPNCKSKDYITPKPCVTELTSAEIIDGVKRMLNRWKI